MIMTGLFPSFLYNIYGDCMIELYLLEQLDAFARNGTLSKAAEELHITQPALTRSMKKLEEEKGYSLFNREGRKITLNEGGRIVAQYAERILSEEKEMDHALDQWQRSMHTVTIGSCAPMPIARLMPSLQIQFPDKAIVTVTAENDKTLIDRLKARDMMVAILHEKPDISGLFCQRYIHENICIFVKKDHPLAKKKSVTLKELSDYSILVSRHIGFWLPLCQKVLPDSLFIQDTIDALDELAESSNTPMFNSDAMIQDGYESGDRIAIPIEDECMHAVYYCACLEENKNTLRTLFNAVRSEAVKDI